MSEDFRPWPAEREVEIPCPHDFPLDKLTARFYEIGHVRLWEDPPRPQAHLPGFTSVLHKRTIAYPYLLWVPETVHYQFNGQDIEAPYWKFYGEPMREAIKELVASTPLPKPGAHPATTVAIGEAWRKTFYLTLKSTVHWHTITGWVDQFDLGRFDATH